MRNCYCPRPHYTGCSVRAVGLFDGPHATKRGFNLAVLHPATGVVTRLGKFDVGVPAGNHKASVPVCRLTAICTLPHTR